MNFELFIILLLIFVFLLSCGGLLQKIRQGYDERVNITVQRIPVSQTTYQNRAFNHTEETSGVFPAEFYPPPYTVSYAEPPPKYEEVIKESVVINVPEIGRVCNSQNSNNNNNNNNTTITTNG